MKPLTKDDLLYIREEELYGLKWDKYMISCVTLKDVLAAKKWLKNELFEPFQGSHLEKTMTPEAKIKLIDEAFGK